jgi:hypothetical protein
MFVTRVLCLIVIPLLLGEHPFAVQLNKNYVRVCHFHFFFVYVLHQWISLVTLEEVEITLRLTISQSVCLGIEHPCGTCNQILLPVGMLLSESCGLVSVGRPLYIPKEQDGPVLRQRHVTTDGQSISMSCCLVHAALEGLHPNGFQSDIRRCTLRRNVLCYHWEGCIWSMQCNVEFGYLLSICSGTKEKHGKPWSSWPAAGSFGWKLRSEVTLRLTVSRSVSQSVCLGVEPTLGLATRY